MKITSTRGLSVAAAVTLAAGVAMAGAPSADAATKGNIETKGPIYYCDNGAQKFVIYTRTLKTQERVSYSVSGSTRTLPSLKPGKDYGYVYALRDLGGRSYNITFKGVTSGDSLRVSVKVPNSCAGLPKGRPSSGWAGNAVGEDGQTTTTSTSSTATTSTGSSSSTTSEPTHSSSASTSGPPVQTDDLATGTDAGVLALMGLLAMGAAVTGGAAVRLRGSKR